MATNAYNNDNWYEYLRRIKSIPITDICRHFGIQIEERGGKKWCKIRDERTSSVLLRDDLMPNMYVDFGGSNRRCDVIQFVCEYKNMERKDAIKYLSDAFNIKMERQNYYQRQNRDPNEVAFWEWEKIGLSGDMATKNFTFDFEKQSMEQVAEISAKYAMPMNDLRKKHPKIYEQLLWDQAIPFMRDLRNNYYLSVINLHHILKITDFSKHPDLKESLMADVKALQTAEEVFKRAADKTSIKALDEREYDPEKDLKKLLAGEIRPSIGNASKKELAAAAETRKCDVWHRPIPWDKFSSRGLDRFQHSAYIKGDDVLISYLSSDYKEIKPLFDKMAGKAPLQDAIKDAESKRQSSGTGAGGKTMHEPER